MLIHLCRSCSHHWSLHSRCHHHRPSDLEYSGHWCTGTGCWSRTGCSPPHHCHLHSHYLHTYKLSWKAWPHKHTKQWNQQTDSFMNKLWFLWWVSTTDSCPHLNHNATSRWCIVHWNSWTGWGAHRWGRLKRVVYRSTSNTIPVQF